MQAYDSRKKFAEDTHALMIALKDMYEKEIIDIMEIAYRITRLVNFSLSEDYEVKVYYRPYHRIYFVFDDNLPNPNRKMVEDITGSIYMGDESRFMPDGAFSIEREYVYRYWEVYELKKMIKPWKYW